MNLLQISTNDENIQHVGGFMASHMLNQCKHMFLWIITNYWYIMEYDTNDWG